jgi:hypothetical protein
MVCWDIKGCYTSYKTKKKLECVLSVVDIFNYGFKIKQQGAAEQLCPLLRWPQTNHDSA